MKALVWTNPRELQIQDVSNPEVATGELLLRVRYAGICGSELSGYLGENSLRKPPLIMGHEFSGAVVEIGENVESFKKGDLVTVNPLVSCGTCRVCKKGLPQYCSNKSILGIHCPGAFAEYVKVPASACYLIKDALAGSLVEPLACSVRAAGQANIQLGDSVVIFGAGAIGLFAMKVAALSGASRRILVDTNEHRLELGTKWGATHLINPREVNSIEAIREISNGGVQKVIDAVGLPFIRQQAVQVLESGGRVVFIGLHSDETTLPGNLIVRKEIEIFGSFAYTDSDFQKAHSLLERKVVVPDQSWLDVRPLAAGKAAFDEQIDGPATYPKIVLSLD